MKTRILAAALAGMALMVGFSVTPTRAAERFHCDEACENGSCEFNQYTFTVCIGGPGTIIPCEEGSCG